MQVGGGFFAKIIFCMKYDDAERCFSGKQGPCSMSQHQALSHHKPIRNASALPLGNSATFICVSLCVCVCECERERKARKRKKTEGKNMRKRGPVLLH